jgi:hypothetical protein
MYKNGKMRTAETILRMGKAGQKTMMQGVNLKYIVSTFINVTMYTQYNNIIFKILMV